MRNFILGFILALALAAAGYWLVTTKPFGLGEAVTNRAVQAKYHCPMHPTYSGRVTYINPTLDEKTRTVKARIEMANPQATLKPEMYGDVLIHGSRGFGVAVPDDAVISTGERNIVFVAKGNGIFEPREVTLGVKVRNLCEIKSGVSAGEQVVTGANFLLDSESKLKATLATGASGGAGHKHGE